jgi:ATP-dependent Lon protease
VVIAELVSPPPSVGGASLQPGAWIAFAGAMVMLAGAVLSLGRVSFSVAIEGRDTRRRVAAVDHRDPTTESGTVVARRAGEVTEMFMRIARAMRTANDERGALPDLPQDDPERLSFLVAAVVEMDAEAKQRLLETRSTSERLRRLYTLLAQAVSAYEARARTHELSRGNGHAGRKIDFEE